MKYIVQPAPGGYVVVNATTRAKVDGTFTDPREAYKAAEVWNQQAAESQGR